VGFRFRRSIKILPGIRWNFSKTGTSWSFGGSPFTVNIRKGRVRRTISIPGTGMSWQSTRKLAGRPSTSYNSVPHNTLPAVADAPDTPAPPRVGRIILLFILFGIVAVWVLAR
jgi:hypothetical protein